LRVHLPDADLGAAAAKESELHAPSAGTIGGGRLCLRDEIAVGVARLGEASGQSAVGAIALSLGGVAPKSPGCDCERSREQQERGDEPNPAGAGAYFPPPRS
jgi:hypothetical protein